MTQPSNIEEIDAMTGVEIERLKQQKARLEEKLTAIKRRASEVQRKADTRRKIVVGGAVLREIAERPDAARYMASLLHRRVSDRDRDLVADLLVAPEVSERPDATHE